MADVIPAGDWSLQLTNFEDLLANVAAFQSWVGEITAAAAKNHIKIIASGGVTKPFALITQGDAFGYSSFAGGAASHHFAQGSVKVKFFANVSTAYINDPRNAELEFTNPVGAIMKGVSVLTGQDGYMYNYDITKTSGPTRNARDEKNSTGDCFDAEYLIKWGP